MLKAVFNGNVKDFIKKNKLLVYTAYGLYTANNRQYFKRKVKYNLDHKMRLFSDSI